MISFTWRVVMTAVIVAALSLAVGSVAEIEIDAEHEEVEFKTEDSELIYGDLFVVNKGSRYAWGSSYSGALVLRLGMEHPDELSGVLAFSPAVGQAMYPCSTSVYVKNIEVPSFLAATAAGVSKYRGAKKRKTRKLAAAAADYVDTFYIADNGVHGASMLDPERVGGDVEKHWNAVLYFMKSNP